MKTVSGHEQAAINIRRLNDKYYDRIGKACEKTGEQIANDAKKDHIPGQAHNMDRYENRSTNLTRSIKARLDDAFSEDEIVCLVFSEVEYAEFVETIYPFLWPATVENEDLFIENVKKAIEGK